jgi:CheY-like chemotaxis protein
LTERRARVLVVDDEAHTGTMLRRALAPDCEVVAVVSGQDALARVAGGEDFDVILCDLLMPGMDGVLFYERLDAIAPELVGRVVLMTAGAFTPRARGFLQAVALTCLDKPFHLDELKRLIATRLAERHA